MRTITTLALDYGGVLAGFIQEESLRAMSKYTKLDYATFTERYWKYRPDFDRDHHTLEGYWQLVSNEENPPIDSLSLLDLDGWREMNHEMIEWAKSIKERGVTLALLSNMSTPTYEALQQDDRWPAFFDHYIISGLLKVNKPDRVIYEHVVNVSNTPAAQILFLDDLELNVIAAQEAGMQAIHYQGMGELQKQLKESYPNLL